MDEFIFGQMRFLLTSISGANILRRIVTDGYIIKFIKYSEIIIKIITPLTFLFVTWKRVISDQDISFINILTRVTIAAILIAMFPGLLFQSVEKVNGIAVNFLETDDVKESINELETQMVIESEEEEDKNKLTLLKAIKQMGILLDKFTNTIINLTLGNLLAELSILLSIVVVFVMMIIRNVLLVVLIFIAPFTFPFLISPNLANIFWGWFKFFTNVLIWPIIISFILYAQGLIMRYALAETMWASELALKTTLIAYNFSFILLLALSMILLYIIESGGASLLYGLTYKLMPGF
mgnify:CR=1 FL=1